VVTVEPCTNSALKRALEGIKKQDYMIGEPLDLQMLE